MSKYWYGSKPETCDICQRAIEAVFIDGSTLRGQWAKMDEFCHDLFGHGLGAGKGQKYEQQADGRWLKTEG